MRTRAARSVLLREDGPGGFSFRPARASPAFRRVPSWTRVAKSSPLRWEALLERSSPDREGRVRAEIRRHGRERLSTFGLLEHLEIPKERRETARVEARLSCEERAVKVRLELVLAFVSANRDRLELARDSSEEGEAAQEDRRSDASRRLLREPLERVAKIDVSDLVREDTREAVIVRAAEIDERARDEDRSAGKRPRIGARIL